ncbi:pimeloyl-ACP methyl ester esterase BioH [Paraglaciecola sp. 2405UD69-4]|uniref:pimeloyl-ACP methyl ester esterase BioH n=1 Tax=Paraglaciecola sp. 2405UD69-4 TaxID=3391836 RepID=UPI0039C93DA5
MSINLNVTKIGQGPNLVFLHGWGVNSGVWQPLIDILAKEYSITTIDLPGYGQNHDKLPEPYDIDTVSALIAAHLPTSCVLIGWSLGGLIAQQIAYDFPEKLSQLILVCSTPKFAKEPDWPGIEKNVLMLFARQLSLDFSKMLERFLMIQAMGSENAKFDVKTIKQNVQQYPNPSETALMAGLNMLEKVDLRVKLNQLTMPCHIFLGRLDSLVPAAVSEQLRELSPTAKVEVIAHASHAPFISDTEGFVKRLLGALTL